MKTLTSLVLGTLVMFGCGKANQNSTTASAAAPAAASADATANFVRLVLSCHTGDGAYSISTIENDGIGPDRTGVLSATIKDADGNVVGSYGPLKRIQSSFSISFGHPDYIDTRSNGADFTLALASTNTPVSVSAILSDGTKIVYGLRFDPNHVNEGTLTCSSL